jgi:serine/threonine protein kinase
MMEFLEGIDVETLVLCFGPVPAERAIFILRHICHSLSEAHSCGLVHRDIKPANIFLCRYGEDDDFVVVRVCATTQSVAQHRAHAIDSMQFQAQLAGSLWSDVCCWRLRHAARTNHRGRRRDATSRRTRPMTTIVSRPIARLTFALLLLIAGRSSAPAEPLRHIFFAEAPAILVQIDGTPEYRHVPGTNLERIVNTRALIVRDGAGLHYLKVLDGWMESYGFDDEWRISGGSPFGENTVSERAVLAATSDRLDRQSVPSAGSLYDNPPTILMATDSAALIVTDGAPRYEPVPGTSLLHLANTKAAVFRERTSGPLYVRVGSDWYSAPTPDGPWRFVATDQLPSSIARQIEGR